MLIQKQCLIISRKIESTNNDEHIKSSLSFELMRQDSYNLKIKLNNPGITNKLFAKVQEEENFNIDLFVEESSEINTARNIILESNKNSLCSKLSKWENYNINMNSRNVSIVDIFSMKNIKNNNDNVTAIF